MSDLYIEVKCPKCGHEFKVRVGKHIFTLVRSGLKYKILEK